MATRAYARVESTAARWCHRIVTVSEFHRDWALRLGIGRPEQLVAIPNGVPEQRLRAVRGRDEVLGELGLADRFVALSTGRLAEQKGLEYLVRAAALLPDDLPPTAILLAGDGPLKDDLARLIAELGVGDTVRLLGFRSDVGDLLAAADLMVLPSLWEGLSISLLEAMAAGKAILTTSIGSNLEVTVDGESAVLVPPKDPAAIASAISRLARDRELRDRLSAGARRTQQERYTLTRMLDAYADEYERLLRPLGNRSPHREQESVPG